MGERRFPPSAMFTRFVDFAAIDTVGAARG